MSTDSVQDVQDAPKDAPKTNSRKAKAKTKPRKAEAKTTSKSGPDSNQIVRNTANLLKQVSDATRLRILLVLSEGRRNVGNLSAELNNSQPAVSHHLALLRHGRLIIPDRVGKSNFYELTDDGRRLVAAVRGLVDGNESD